MNKFTKEQLQQIAETDHVQCGDAAAMARQMLAGLEQEPVAYMYKDRLHTDARFSLHTRFGNWSQEDINEYEITEIPLYAAPQLPQPAVVDERAAFNAWNNEDNLPIAGVGAKNAAWLAWQARAALCGNSVLDVPPERPADSTSGDDVEAWFDEGWNACRAAMLQGAEPVSQTYKLPEGMVIVPVEPTREMRLQIHPIAEATCKDCGRSVTADCEDNVLLSWADMIAVAPQQGVATDNTTQQFESLGLIVTSDVRKMELPRCSKHPETELLIHPFEQLLSYPPQPVMYCPLCKPSVAEWVAMDKQLRSKK